MVTTRSALDHEEGPFSSSEVEHGSDERRISVEAESVDCKDVVTHLEPDSLSGRPRTHVADRVGPGRSPGQVEP